MKSREELLAEAKARGAVIINPDAPGQGFEEDSTHDPRYDHPAVLDAAKRCEDASLKIPAELDELAKEYQEGNIGSVRQYRFLRQEEYIESAWDRGRVLWMGDFLAMLQKIRPDAFLAEYSYLGLRGLGFVHGGKPVYSGVAIQNGNSAEWSLLRIDSHGLPTRDKYRGWRTVLLSLIQQRIITEDQCYSVFGKPKGPRSRPWWRTLYAIRNGICGECKKKTCICQDRYDYLRSDPYQYIVPDEIKAGKRMEAMPRPDGTIWMP